MTTAISAEELRRLLPSPKRARLGCHEISKGVLLEIIEEASWKAHSHIVGSFPDGEAIEPGFDTGPIFSFYCDDSYVDVRSGTTIVDGQVVREPAFRSYDFPSAAELNEARVLDPAQAILPLASVRMKNYCRYWIDSISKLYVHEKSSQLRALAGRGGTEVVAPKLKLGFQREAADLVGARVSIRIHKRTRLVRGRTMNATGVVYGGQQVGALVSGFCDWLDSAIPASSQPKAAPGERLYVSRNESDMRRVLNEEAILPALRDLGFEVIRPGEMPLIAQIDRFRRAKVVLAPHGAGLTNILFCRPQTTLIEIFPRGGVHGSMFLRIASQRGFRYYFAVAESVANARSETNPNNADIFLEPASFISFVRQIV